jgi:hypothetical protein
MTIVKPIPRPAPKSAVERPAEYKDEHNVVYLGNEAVVRVAVEVKLSQNYQSAGIQASVEFRTPAVDVPKAITGSATKLKGILGEQIRRLSNSLETSFESGLL